MRRERVGRMRMVRASPPDFEDYPARRTAPKVLSRWLTGWISDDTPSYGQICRG